MISGEQSIQRDGKDEEWLLGRKSNPRRTQRRENETRFSFEFKLNDRNIDFQDY